MVGFGVIFSSCTPDLAPRLQQLLDRVVRPFFIRNAWRSRIFLSRVRQRLDYVPQQYHPSFFFSPARTLSATGFGRTLPCSLDAPSPPSAPSHSAFPLGNNVNTPWRKGASLPFPCIWVSLQPGSRVRHPLLSSKVPFSRALFMGQMHLSDLLLQWGLTFPLFWYGAPFSFREIMEYELVTSPRSIEFVPNKTPPPPDRSFFNDFAPCG